MTHGVILGTIVHGKKDIISREKSKVKLELMFEMPSFRVEKNSQGFIGYAQDHIGFINLVEEKAQPLYSRTNESVYISISTSTLTIKH